VGDDIRLRLFAYNSNNRTNFNSVRKVDLYFLDPHGKTPANPDGRVLMHTVPAEEITHTEVGLYEITVHLEDTKFSIGKWLDVWHVIVQENQEIQEIENGWEIYPELWYTTPIPIVYDFSFAFRPNKIRQGSKKYLIIDIEPNVPKASDLDRYYQNLAIAAPLKINIEMAECSPCVPQERDLRIIAENQDVELRERMTGYYFLDTTDMNPGIYNVWFELNLGESKHISDVNQLQIF